MVLTPAPIKSKKVAVPNAVPSSAIVIDAADSPALRA